MSTKIKGLPGAWEKNWRPFINPTQCVLDLSASFASLSWPTSFPDSDFLQLWHGQGMIDLVVLHGGVGRTL